MLGFIIRKFIPNHEATGDARVRTAYGMLAGALGMALNLLLFLIKLPIGLSLGSIAVMSDAFNNISDMGSSAISLIGAHMAGKRSDRDHPFGHGRLEYVSALAVAFLILLMGVELLRQSVGKFTSPSPPAFAPLPALLLALSTVVKLWMFLYNRKLGRLLDSPVMLATAKDSLGDVFITGGVVLAMAISPLTTWPVDAIAGSAVSVLILYTGYQTARDAIDLLLGGKRNPELAHKIEGMVKGSEGVIGMHDLILHDYGPGRVMASVHAEVPADGDIVRLHELIDEAEQRIARELNVPIVIHMDPVATDDARLDEARHRVQDAVTGVNPAFSFHDLRMTDGEARINLIFDLVVPPELDASARAEAARQIGDALRAFDPRYQTVIQIDDDFAL